MKAVVKVTSAPGAEIREVPIPNIAERDILIKVKAAASLPLSFAPIGLGQTDT